MTIFQIGLRAQACPLSFSSYTLQSFSAQVNNIAAGDFDNDGKLDVAVTDFMSPRFFVLMGSGNGIFQSPTTFTTPNGLNGTAEIVSGDFNNDTKIDLAVGLKGGGDLGIFLGDGTGSFAIVDTVPVCFYNSNYGLLADDLDQDGNLDLVVSNVNLYVLLGTGTGTFGTATLYTVGPSPGGITMGDFNADGKKDLATTIANFGSVSVLLGDGAGTFTSTTTFSSSNTSWRVVNGDIDLDGKLDLVVSRADSFYVSIFPGLGGGSFGTPIKFYSNNPINDIVLKDMNADGKLDLILSSPQSWDVQTFKGNGTFTFDPQTQHGVANWPDRLIVADLGGDALPDIAVATRVILGVCSMINETCINTGEDEFEMENSKAKVFPNPTKGIFNITGEVGSEIRVYNSLGEQIFEGVLRDNNSELNISHQPIGIYFARVCSGPNSGKTVKLVKE